MRWDALIMSRSATVVDKMDTKQAQLLHADDLETMGNLFMEWATARAAQERQLCRSGHGGVHSLPNELLREVFKLVVLEGSATTNLLALYRLALVCPKWWGVLLQCRELWTNVDFGRPDQAVEFVRRAGRTKLLHVKWLGDDATSEVPGDRITELASSSSRWASLQCGTITAQMLPFLRRPLHHLKEMSVSSSSHQHLPDRFFGGVSLETLNLRNTNLPLDPIPLAFATLTTLRLVGSDSPLDLPELSSLKMCFKLEALTLERVTCRSMTKDAVKAKKRVQLPHLQSLCLRYMTGKHLGGLLQTLESPSLRRFDILWDEAQNHKAALEAITTEWYRITPTASCLHNNTERSGFKLEVSSDTTLRLVGHGLYFELRTNPQAPWSMFSTKLGRALKELTGVDVKVSRSKCQAGSLTRVISAIPRIAQTEGPKRAVLAKPPRKKGN